MTLKKNMELTDKELAVRWWGRRTTQEQYELLNKYLGRSNFNNLSSDDKYWIWKQNQEL